MDRKIGALVACFFVAAILLSGCAQNSPQGPGNNTGTGDNGRGVFTISDAAANMGAVSSVKVTVENVRVHSAAQGWVTVSSTPQTYDLLDLKAQGNQALLADAELKPGIYDQLRLEISKVTVVDVNGSHDARLPSGELKIVGGMQVNENSTSSAEFDFEASESLHQTGNGTYIFAPVVQLETRANANVSVNSQNDVQVNGGTVVTVTKAGMDERGNVGVNVRIPASANVSIDPITGSINVVHTGRLVAAITDPSADMDSVTSIKVTVDGVRVHSATSGWTEISNEQKTYDLLVLRGQSRTSLLADAQIKEGTYGQLRLDISKIEVTDANGTTQAKLPSGEIKIMGEFDVGAGSTAAATFDFYANKSLHKTGNGKYIFAPVINLRVEEGANAEVDTDDDVEIRGGRSRVNTVVGMDVNGNVGVGIGIPANAILTIEGNLVKIKAKGLVNMR